MIATVFEPRFFNFLIMGLYTCAALWWLAHGRPWDSAYWLAALSITFVVTFGYRH